MKKKNSPKFICDGKFCVAVVVVVVEVLWLPNVKEAVSK